MRACASRSRWCCAFSRSHPVNLGIANRLSGRGYTVLGGNRYRLVQRTDGWRIDVLHGGQVVQGYALPDGNREKVGPFLDALAADHLGADEAQRARLGDQLD